MMIIGLTGTILYSGGNPDSLKNTFENIFKLLKDVQPLEMYKIETCDYASMIFLF